MSMGDSKQYTIQIKGTAYRFKPIPDDDIVRVQLIFNMNASPTKTVKAITRILKASAGDEQWDLLTDRLIEEEISLQDMVVTPVKELVKRQTKDAAKSGTTPDAE